MPIAILMPALSPTMTHGNLVKWHKKEGDRVRAGDLLAEIETDKATMEVEAVDEGTIAKIVVPEGTNDVAVNALIGVLLEEGDTADVAAFMASYQNKTATPTASSTVAAEQAPAPAPTPTLIVASNERVIASPLARRLAEQNRVDLHRVGGSGPKGRVVKADVLAALSAPRTQSFGPVAAPRDVPLSSMRRVIAKRLTESKQTVPHFYLSMDCCLDTLTTMRHSLNDHLDGVKLSVNDFVIRAVALALKKVPEVNATWHGDFIRYYDTADISVAVAIEDGLITPIVRVAEQKTVVDISQEMKDLARKARDGKLKPEEFQGGSFSISNLGMYGVKDFAAIINPPQGCILAVGAGEDRVIAVDGQMKVAKMMTCTLSVDHRVVDGKAGALFLAAFKKIIENPVVMFV